MIEKLRIENFKSVKKLDLACKKINIFIGEPNAGKSNIIEALGIFSEGNTNHLRELIRFRSFADVFFNKEVSQPVKIIADDLDASISFKDFEYRVDISRGSFGSGMYITVGKENQIGSGNIGDFITPFKFYKYKPLTQFKDKKPGSLSAPNGDNLIASIITNQKSRDLIGEIYNSKGLRLLLNEERNDITLIKNSGNISLGYSFESTSETLRRITFLILALETNKNSSLIFDEPEANTFPFYTQYLAERIAADETNQYFLTTHNLYLLRSVLEHAEKQDIQIIITYMENEETKIRVMTEDELGEIIDIDIFLNLDLFIGDAAHS